MVENGVLVHALFIWSNFRASEGYCFKSPLSSQLSMFVLKFAVLCFQKECSNIAKFIMLLDMFSVENLSLFNQISEFRKSFTVAFVC